MTDVTYERTRRVTYGDDGDSDGASFIPVCAGKDGHGGCGRFVRADDGIRFTVAGPPVDKPNATCAHCGRVQMWFEGYP